jgi:hypothetical protein
MLFRHCEEGTPDEAIHPRHCESSEAIQELEDGLLRREYPPRNDEISMYPRNDETSF